MLGDLSMMSKSKCKMFILYFWFQSVDESSRCVYNNLFASFVRNRDRFTRAIEKDIPLLPIVFVVMSVFTCIIFAKRDKVQSRSLLEFGGVVSVLLSILTGFGLMWVCGVPFTSMTPLIPFIVRTCLCLSSCSALALGWVVVGSSTLLFPSTVFLVRADVWHRT
jgi:hypothetical protein